MLKKTLYSFVIVLFLLSYVSLVYGDDITFEVTKIRFIYQDDSSEIREINPAVFITFYGDDGTYDSVRLNNTTDLQGKVITAINFYVGTGWLGEGAITIMDINDPHLYNALGDNLVDLGQCSTITTKCYYDGKAWLPATPGPEPTPLPEPEPTPNNAPSINQLTANPSSITYPNTSEILFSVSDPDGDDISWTGSISGGVNKGSLSSSSGTVSDGSGSISITYTPENTDSSFTIHINLDDGNGNEDSDSVVVTVSSAPINNSPQIRNLTANPNPIKDPHPNSRSNITFDVNDSEGDDVKWTATITAGPSPQGDITPPNGTVNNGVGSVSTDYKPKKKTPDGTFTITIELDDDNGGTDTDTIDIELDRD